MRLVVRPDQDRNGAAMTDLKSLLERARKVERKASPGPWRAETELSFAGSWMRAVAPRHGHNGKPAEDAAAFDAAFIAISRNLLGPLLDVADAARGGACRHANAHQGCPLCRALSALTATELP